LITGNPRIVLLAEATGGVTRHVIDLYRGLRARSWQVSLVLSPVRLEARLRDELTSLDQRDITFIPMRRAPHTSDLKAALTVGRLLESCSQDVILHAHSTKAGMIGARVHSRALASIFTPHAYRGVDPNLSAVLRACCQMAEHNFSKGYDRILAVSPGEVEYARKIGIRDQVLRCVPNGLDTSHVRFRDVFERRRHLPERLCLGFVGRLVYQKNPALFLQVVAEVVRRGRDATAMVVGDGPMKREMLALATRLGIHERIHWYGDVTAVGLLPHMDVMVHTSVYEGLPYSLIEACADLLPVVATVNFGSETLFRERLPENLVNSQSAGDLVSTILTIAENEPLRISQMRTLEEIAKTYSLEAMVTGIESEYCALMARSGRLQPEPVLV
jgi:glycosyltransferase involved in cell wall biosynthesis